MRTSLSQALSTPRAIDARARPREGASRVAHACWQRGSNQTGRDLRWPLSLLSMLALPAALLPRMHGPLALSLHPHSRARRVRRHRGGTGATCGQSPCSRSCQRPGTCRTLLTWSMRAMEPLFGLLAEALPAALSA